MIINFRQSKLIVKSILGEGSMLRTIILGSCVSVQGQFVRQLDNGKIVVQVGDRTFEGKPVNKAA